MSYSMGKKVASVTKVTTTEKSAMWDGMFPCSADHDSETEIRMFRCLHEPHRYKSK
jgi:hypothetical protein